jgi:hypothetical protein
MSLGQDIFGSFLQHTWSFVKGEIEIRDVARMSPEELARWREAEYRKIHDQAVKLAGISSDKALAKRGETRADVIRVYEVLQRGRRGLEMSQNLLAGFDVRGLDMSKVRPGHISQEHMATADGDRNTRLPSDLRPPESWLSR